MVGEKGLQVESVVHVYLIGQTEHFTILNTHNTFVIIMNERRQDEHINFPRNQTKGLTPWPVYNAD